jgi:hypothetical protein
MNKVFIAYPFKPKAGAVVLDIVAAIDRLIESHSLAPLDGRSVGGKSLTPAVRHLITESDALIALFTREQQLAGKNRWLPTTWVQTEITAARQQGKPAVALVVPGVEVSGLFAEHERIDVDLKHPLDSLLQLSQAIRIWKEDAGRFLLVRLIPQAAAMMAQNKNSQCKVRLVPQRGQPGAWQTSTVRTPPGGVFLEVPGVKENVAIEVEIFDGNGHIAWKSIESPQWVHVEMTSV